MLFAYELASDHAVAVNVRVIGDATGLEALRRRLLIYARPDAEQRQVTEVLTAFTVHARTQPALVEAIHQRYVDWVRVTQAIFRDLDAQGALREGLDLEHTAVEYLAFATGLGRLDQLDNEMFETDRPREGGRRVPAPDRRAGRAGAAGHPALTAAGSGAAASARHRPAAAAEAVEDRLQQRQEAVHLAAADHAVPHRLELLPAGGVGEVAHVLARVAVDEGRARDVAPAVELAVGAPVAGLELGGRHARRREHRVARVVEVPVAARDAALGREPRLQPRAGVRRHDVERGRLDAAAHAPTPPCARTPTGRRGPCRRRRPR